MVVETGSELASAAPSRIEKNGTATSSISAVAASANRAGRLAIQSVQRRQAGDSSLLAKFAAAIARRSLRRSTRPPNNASRAGVRVIADITVSATVIAADTATPNRNETPSSIIPSIATQTIAPANITARPEVSSASTTASSRSSPRIIPWR